MPLERGWGRKRRTAVIAALLALSATFATRAAGATAPAWPVSYDFTLNAVEYGIAANPPGANDWTCKPSAVHPEPVVLVPGTGGAAATNWATYSALLADNGYCVFALTYGVLPVFAALHIPVGGLNTIESSAGELAAFVAKVRAATGASKVDIVGHSQGTLMPDYYVLFDGGRPYVDKYISLAPLWHGVGSPQMQTSGFAIPVCASCSEMEAGSAMLQKMQAAGEAAPGVKYTNIVTEHDEVVTPYTSGIEAGMTNIVVQNGCPQDLSDHLEIASDPVASVYVLNALDPTHPRPVPCETVLPAIGPLG